MDDFSELEAVDAAAAEKSGGAEQAEPAAKAKAKGRGKGTAGGQGGKQKNDSCFLPACEEKKLKNSKFCRQHHRPYEALKYQAAGAKPPETKSFMQIMSDPSRAQAAIEDFIRENPEGTSRKKLVDWVAWKRDHGVRIAYTVREGEVLLGIDDYFLERSKPKGMSRADSDAEFKELLKGHYDREGEGALTKLWLPKFKERMRDRSHYIDASKEPEESAANSQTGSDTKSEAATTESSKIRRQSSSSKKPAGEQVSEMLHRQLAEGKSALIVQDTGALLSRMEMAELIEKVLTAKSIAELDEKLEIWKKCVEQVKLLAGRLSKSAQNLSCHVANLTRKVQRDENKRKRSEETLALKEVQKKAKAAAKKVKEAEATVLPIFQIGLDKLQSDDGAAMKAMRDSEMYKKTESFTSTGRAQMVLFQKEGKEESQDLLNSFLAKMPDKFKVKAENSFARILETLWLYGYDPNMACISPSPNGMAMIKFLAYGEVKWLAMEASSLAAALRAELSVETVGVDDLEKLVGNLTYDNLLACSQKHGLKAFCCKQSANEGVFVPAGWIIAEQCVKGVLVYGLRATLLLKSEAAHRNYETVLGFHAASKKPNLDRMQEALDLMVPPET
eukprot:g23949.t1